MQPQWINEYGFTLRDTGEKIPGWFPWSGKTIYEYTANPEKPMILYDGCEFIQTDWHFLTDLASVPKLLQPIFPKDLHNPSSCLHDDACEHKGLYFSNSLDGPYVYRRISSWHAAELYGLGLRLAGRTVRAHAYILVGTLGPHWKVEVE